MITGLDLLLMRILCFPCPGHNEFATKARPMNGRGFRKGLTAEDLRYKHSILQQLICIRS